MYRETIKFMPDKEFTDITDDINNYIELSEIKNGIIILTSQHTTCGLKIMENELLSLNDIDNFLEKLIPLSDIYTHDKIYLRQVPLDERINGASHVRMLYFETSITLPINDGKLLLGKWQRLFLVEMDGNPIRYRTFILTIMN